MTFPVSYAVGDHLEESDFFSLLANHRFTVLYFYPKDNTPGCSVEAQEFASLYSEFSSLGVGIVGVSKDSFKSHCNFIKKYKLPFPLVIDTDLVLHQHFGTYGEKKMYGKTYKGTVRSTFVVDCEGKIVKEWRNVKARDHAQIVYECVQTLS